MHIHKEEVLRRGKNMAKELVLLPSMIQQPDGTEIPLDSLTPEKRKEFVTQLNIRAFAAIGIKARVAEGKDKEIC